LATIYKIFPVQASPAFVWDAIRDVGAVHLRLAQGLVKNTVFVGEVRTVSYFNGIVVQERIVTVSDELRRLVYASVGGSASHHNASMQVFAGPDETARVLWVTDLLPEEAKVPFTQMIEAGAAAIQKTLESAFRKPR